MTSPEPNPGDLPDLDALFGNPDALTVPVRECPRCEGEHVPLVFQPFREPSDHTHWATCPETGEPITMLVCFS